MAENIDNHDAHHKQSFISKYIFSTDHKVIGIQYALTGMFFFMFGFLLMIAMRLSIAYPDASFPFLNWFLPQAWLENGNLTPESYNMFGAMHGIIMIFFGIMPVAFAGFGNLIVPLQIGAIDMCFPRLNMTSYWLFFLGCVVLLFTFFMDGGPAQSGWTIYAPLSTVNGKPGFYSGQTFLILSLALIITSSLFGSLNFIATMANLRCPGMTWMRMPYFCWAILVAAFILLLALPPLEAAAIMQLMDRCFGSSLFSPTGLVVANEVMQYSGGGSPILFQHLFWFLGHPEVYVLLLPAIAAVTEVIPPNIRRPLWGYKPMVYATLVLGFLSFIVWAHHMYLTDMGNKVATFFQTTTVIISIPSVILLTCLIISLWGGRIRFTPPMLWAVAFIPMFGIGGLTGIPLAFSITDVYLHDTYYIIGHFHYVVAPGILFGIFAGVYHWFPKVTGRLMNNKLTHLHFWPSLVSMNLIFFPMIIQGMAGFHRRWYDGGVAFPQTTEKWLWLNEVMTVSSFVLLAAQIPFLINFFGSIFVGKKIEDDNPWQATTLEWAAPSPPPHGNFPQPIAVNKGAYEYSAPGSSKDFSPQWQGATINEKGEVGEDKDADILFV